MTRQSLRECTCHSVRDVRRPTHAPIPIPSSQPRATAARNPASRWSSWRVDGAKIWCRSGHAGPVN
ncbi:hypothetical protein RSAG8_05221, partial [Rhizoctonia solani AG-8 WAC10335]